MKIEILKRKKRKETILRKLNKKQGEFIEKVMIVEFIKRKREKKMHYVSVSRVRFYLISDS